MGNLPKLTMIVEFLAAPNILNDGISENTLNIGVFNTALPSADGAAAADLVLKAGTPLYFWFITDDRQANEQPARPWGLTSAGYLFDPVVKVEANGKWKWSKSENVAGRPDLKGFGLSPEQDVTLKPGEHLAVRISGLKSALPDGPTTAFFGYAPDGFEPFRATYGPIQKSPIYTKGQQVGIGTHPNNVRLAVKGDADIQGDINIQGNTEIQGNTQVEGLLGFSTKNGQKINLNGTKMGVGFQTGGMYLRTDEKSNFNIYQGGTHSDESNNAGGGKTLMKFSSDGTLNLFGPLKSKALHVEGNAQINKNDQVEFGAGIEEKQEDAGKIGYETFSDGLDIVGAGTEGYNRKITLWAEGGLTVKGTLYVNSISFGFHFIIPVPLVTANNFADFKHTCVDLAPFVPPETTAVILQTFGGGKDGSLNAFVSNDNKTEYMLFSHHQTNSGPIVNQGIYPISKDRKIWFWRDGIGYFDYGIVSSIVGYYGPAKK